jgi:predicted nuclease of restriction endonuclease-like (RecB) superfamily
VTTSRGKKAASKKGVIARVSERRAEVLQQPLQNPVALEPMPAGYPEWLADVKARVHAAQLRSAHAANRELLMFYWDLGRDISEKIARGGYGAKVVDRLSHDLKADFPTMKGFSPRNLKYMRRFADLWPDPEIVQQLLHNLPWFHLCTIMDKAAKHRDWYARAAVEYGWSRPILVMQIETGAHERFGKATTNFERTLPKPLSDLALETLKDPYRFDFTGLSREAEERHVERALVEHITEFLIELGAGFAYVGRQVPLVVGEREFYLDLLFYHLRLRAYVVIELKAVEFEPEHLGQLGFYLAAVDGQVKRPDDAPSIGLLLCKTKDAVVAEYALKSATGPIGVSEYQLVESLPKDLAANLPSIERIEEELSKAATTRKVAEGLALAAAKSSGAAKKPNAPKAAKKGRKR